MQDLDWNDLRIFKAIADAGQINRAALALKVNSTTVSRRLKRLEKQLETTLFEKTREGQTITEAGEKLLEKVETMGILAASINDEMGAHLGLSGTLRISVSEGFGSQFLTRYLKDFGIAHPNLTIELVANSGFLNPSRRETDIAVMLSRPKAGPLLCRKLSDYQLGLYASADYLDRVGRPENPSELATNHTLVSYVPDLLFAPELNYLGELHPGLEAQLRSSSINAQTQLVAGGAGIGVLPHFIGQPHAALINICPEFALTRSFWIVTHRDTNNLARVKAGKEWLDHCVASGRNLLLPKE